MVVETPSQPEGVQEANTIVSEAVDASIQIQQEAERVADAIVTDAVIEAQEIRHDAELREVSAYHAEERAAWTTKQAELEAEIARLSASNSMEEAIAETILEAEPTTSEVLTPPAETLEAVSETPTELNSTPLNISEPTSSTETEALSVSVDENPGALPEVQVSVRTPPVRLV